MGMGDICICRGSAFQQQTLGSQSSGGKVSAAISRTCACGIRACVTCGAGRGRIGRRVADSFCGTMSALAIRLNTGEAGTEIAVETSVLLFDVDEMRDRAVLCNSRRKCR